MSEEGFNQIMALFETKTNHSLQIDNEQRTANTENANSVAATNTVSIVEKNKRLKRRPIKNRNSGGKSCRTTTKQSGKRKRKNSNFDDDDISVGGGDFDGRDEEDDDDDDDDDGGWRRHDNNDSGSDDSRTITGSDRNLFTSFGGGCSFDSNRYTFVNTTTAIVDQPSTVVTESIYATTSGNTSTKTTKSQMRMRGSERKKKQQHYVPSSSSSIYKPPSNVPLLATFIPTLSSNLSSLAAQEIDQINKKIVMLACLNIFNRKSIDLMELSECVFIQLCMLKRQIEPSKMHWSQLKDYVELFQWSLEVSYNINTYINSNVTLFNILNENHTYKVKVLKMHEDKTMCTNPWIPYTIIKRYKLPVNYIAKPLNSNGLPVKFKK